jgi:short-subunit dehydrogenase
MPPPLLVLAVVPVVCALWIWQTIDTTPSLLLYDALVPLQADTFANHNSTTSTTTFWIIGASSGIGAALACQVAAAGATHVILSARNVTRLTHVAETCAKDNSTGTTFSIVPYDAMSDNATTIVAQALATLPQPSSSSYENESTTTTSSTPLDVLIWSTGIYQLQPAMETTDMDRQRLWQTNYHAAVSVTQALLQDHWKNHDDHTHTTTSSGGTGHVVLISSLMAKGPHALCSTYAATKAALRSYFQTLAVEGTLQRLTMVLPGATATPFFAHTQSSSSSSSTSSTSLSRSTNNTAIAVNTQAMVAPERVARLTAQAIRPGWVPHVLFYEIWISKANGLLYGFMSHHVPGLFYAINHVVGRIRLAAYYSHHADLLTLSELWTYLVSGRVIT